MTPDTEKALRVARWCWPERSYEARDSRILCGGNRLPEWDPDEQRDISAAEAIFIERGLGKDYGYALAEYLYRPEDGLDVVDIIVASATATLSTRLDAMDAAIRSCAK